MHGLDANARRINAMTAARRRNPIAAGTDDGYHAGCMAGFEGAKRLDCRKAADPRWVNDRSYRLAFQDAARRGYADARATGDCKDQM